MDLCPSCNFPVQVEWTECRRCGAKLPLALRDPPGRSRRLPPPPARRALAPSGNGAGTTSPPDRRPPADTLLPRAAGPPGVTPGRDTLLPQPEPVRSTARPSVPRRTASGAAIAAIAAIVVAVDRLVRRRHV